MKVTIDRFEGGYALVELDDRTIVDMPIELIPAGAKEGDVLSIFIDEEETEKRRERIRKLMEELWD